MLPLPLPDHSIKNINFVGSIVRVVMTSSTGSSVFVTGTSDLVANIIFDNTCCPTGSFPPNLQPCGYFRYTTVSLIGADCPWTWPSMNWNTGTVYANNAYNFGPNPPSVFARKIVDGMTSMTGSNTFTAPYTNLYDVVYHVVFGGFASINCKICDFDWQATLYLGNHLLETQQGSVYEDFCGADSAPANFQANFRGLYRNLYLQQGETIDFRIEYTIDNHGDDLDTINRAGGGGNPYLVGLTVYSGWGINPPDYLYDQDQTRFIPLGVTIFNP